MAIEQGAEFFNRENLVTVKVEFLIGDSDDAGQWVNFSVCDDQTTRGGRDAADFLRDYAPNVPVTRELLERMGWERSPGSDSDISRYDLKADDEHTLSVFFVGGDFHGFSLFSDKGSELILPEPATLRDLLNTLRVLGVNAEIPQEVGT